ncbi:MAG: PD40 domain-containing protein [Anaerolineae bacterium]|nr:PD40 domain-containing protein [Anaerolineae bacterium]
MINFATSRFLRIASVLGFLFFSLGCLCSLIAPLEPPPKEENWPSWAPDSQRLVYECYLDGPVDHPEGIDRLVEEGGRFSFYTSEAADLCISDVNKHDQVRLIDDSGGDWHPVWSPDGSQIAYLRKDGIYLITPDGQNRRQLVPIDSSQIRLSWWQMQKGTVAWSPAGDRLLFSGCLDHQDHDVYVVDIDTGTMTNLTPYSRVHDFSPMWTLDGSKIVFLSTDSSISYICSPDENALPQIRAVDVDGAGERVVYNPEFYYPYWQVSVSDSGQIAIVTDMTSRTYEEYYEDSPRGSLYSIDIREGTLTQMRAWRYGEPILLPSWSPSEEYVAFRSYFDLKILNVETGKVFGPREQPFIEPRFVWSPDSQRIAVTISTQEDYVIDSEEHIHVFDVQSQTFQLLIQGKSSP